MIYMQFMAPSSKPSGSIIFAAIIEIICSLLAVLSTAIALLAFRFIPMPASNPQLPPAVKTVMEVMMVLFCALAIFGIFTGVGLLRLKSWARIITLIWAGITAAFSILALLVVPFMPFPNTPNQPVGMEPSIRIFLVVIYGIPLAIGVWWLILFNRKTIVGQFSSSGGSLAHGPAMLPGESFPDVAHSTTAKLSCPLPVAVVAGFSILSSLSLALMLFLRVPAIFFGHPLYGASGTAICVFVCAFYLASGIGLLKLEPWSYALALGLQFFFICSGTVTMLSSNYAAIMREAMASWPMWTNQAYTDEYFHQIRSFSAVGLLFPVLILAVLLYYRARFLQAAEAKASS